MLRSILLRPGFAGAAVALEGWQTALISSCSGSAARGLSTAADAPPKAAAPQQQQQQQQQAPIYAAVVLERLPIVRGPPPEWEASYMAWAEQRRQQRGFYKQYPAQAKKASRSKEDEADDFKPVPIETDADRTGDVRTMKRSLQDKLVLLVKQKDSALAAPVSSSGRGAAGGGWAFPHVRHVEGETVRGAAERALRECAGVPEVFFIGNAPMAHYPLGPGRASSSGSSSSSASSSGGASGAPAGGAAATRSAHTSAAPAAAAVSSAGGEGDSSSGIMFFMLAQVVNDPWELDLHAPFASDHAWVRADELGRYLADERLVELARKMI